MLVWIEACRSSCQQATDFVGLSPTSKQKGRNKRDTGRGSENASRHAMLGRIFLASLSLNFTGLEYYSGARLFCSRVTCNNKCIITTPARTDFYYRESPIHPALYNIESPIKKRLAFTNKPSSWLHSKVMFSNATNNHCCQQQTIEPFSCHVRKTMGMVAWLVISQGQEKCHYRDIYGEE